MANTDPRFRGKVVLVNLMGSRRQNCHDEAPFLAALYRKHAAQGLEIVALDFKRKDQLPDPRRLHAFIARYGIEAEISALLAEPAPAAGDVKTR